MPKRLILCLLGLFLAAGLGSACGSKKTATTAPTGSVTEPATSAALKPTLPPVNPSPGVPAEGYPPPGGLPTSPGVPSQGYPLPSGGLATAPVAGGDSYPAPGTNQPGNAQPTLRATISATARAAPVTAAATRAAARAQTPTLTSTPSGQRTPTTGSTQTSSGYPGPAPTNRPAGTLRPSQTSAVTPSTSAGSPTAASRVGGGPTFTPGPTPTERPFTTAEPPPASRPRTVTIWHSWDEWERLTLEDVLMAFQQVHPEVQFDVLYVPHDELLARYQSAASLGKGPAVLMGPAEWGGILFEAGQVTDLSDIAQPEFLNEIHPAALGEVQYQNALIGLPHTIRSGVVLFRNKEILPDPVSTFDELVREARQANQGGKIGAYLERSFFYSAAHLYGLGGELADENGNPAFNNNTGQAWLELLEDFEQAGATEYDANRDVSLFEDGRVGLVIEGSWMAKQLAKAIGEDNLAIDPWPAYGSGHLSGFVQTDNLYLNPNITGDNQYAALQFMGFFLAREVQAILTRIDHIPAVKNVELDDPLMEQALRAFEGGTPYPIYPEIPLYWDPMEMALSEVLIGSADPAEALEKAAEEILLRIEAE